MKGHPWGNMAVAYPVHAGKGTGVGQEGKFTVCVSCCSVLWPCSTVAIQYCDEGKGWLWRAEV